MPSVGYWTDRRHLHFLNLVSRMVVGARIAAADRFNLRLGECHARLRKASSRTLADPPALSGLRGADDHVCRLRRAGRSGATHVRMRKMRPHRNQDDGVRSDQIQCRWLARKRTTAPQMMVGGGVLLRERPLVAIPPSARAGEHHIAAAIAGGFHVPSPAGKTEGASVLGQ